MGIKFSGHTFQRSLQRSLQRGLQRSLHLLPTRGGEPKGSGAHIGIANDDGLVIGLAVTVPQREIAISQGG